MKIHVERVGANGQRFFVEESLEADDSNEYERSSEYCNRQSQKRDLIWIERCSEVEYLGRTPDALRVKCQNLQKDVLIFWHLKEAWRMFKQVEWRKRIWQI